MKQLIERWVGSVELPDDLNAAINALQDIRLRHIDADSVRIEFSDGDQGTYVYVTSLETDDEERDRMLREARITADRMEREVAARRGQEQAIRQAIARLQQQLDYIEKGETP